MSTDFSNFEPEPELMIDEDTKIKLSEIKPLDVWAIIETYFRDNPNYISQHQIDSFNEFTKILLIFILFRFFDIIKPFPANWIDKNMKNSYGIILDDIIAGIYTIITLTLANVFI